MATKRIDGKLVEDTLLGRIGADERVGEDLQQRTKEIYSSRIGSIERELEDRTGLKATFEEIIEAIERKFETNEISRASGRHLLAACTFWLSTEAQSLLESGEPLGHLELAYSRIRKLRPAGLPSKSSKTSGQKLKHFPSEPLEAITQYVKDKPRATAAATAVAFVNANLLVGLRPEEWLSARFCTYLKTTTAKQNLEPCLALVVDNSKQTHGRSNGATREIVLHGIKESELAALIHFRNQISEFASRYPTNTPRARIAADYFKQPQISLTRALRSLGFSSGALPTLYSTRHQAIADAKASGMTAYEIAAMFGHGSIRTAKRHYGKKSNGRRTTMFRPSPESLSNVGKAAPGILASPSPEAINQATEWTRQRPSNRGSNAQPPH